MMQHITEQGCVERSILYRKLLSIKLPIGNAGFRAGGDVNSGNAGFQKCA